MSSTQAAAAPEEGGRGRRGDRAGLVESFDALLDRPAEEAIRAASAPGTEQGGEARRRCPFCSEWIKARAKKCPWCWETLGHRVEWDGDLLVVRSSGLRFPEGCCAVCARRVETQYLDKEHTYTPPWVYLFLLPALGGVVGEALNPGASFLGPGILVGLVAWLVAGWCAFRFGVTRYQVQCHRFDGTTAWLCVPEARALRRMWESED